MQVANADIGCLSAPKRNERPSRWEWALPVAVPVLASLYFLSESGGSANRFAFFVGIGLLPGTVWRIAGRSSWKLHRIFFAVSLFAFVMANPALRPDADAWRNILLNWRLVLLGFAVSSLQVVWGVLRSHRILIDSGVRISRLDSCKLFLAGSFFNIFLPGSSGGDTYRVYAITRGYKEKLAPALTSITLDRLLGIPSLILIVAMGMWLDYVFFLSSPTLAGAIPLIAIMGAASLAFVAYLAMAGKKRRRADWGEPDPSSGTPNWLRRIHLTIATNVKRPGTLPLALFYGLAANLCCVAACQCFASALGVEGVPAVRYYLIVPLVLTINSIPGAPGGVGQGELAMATFLDLAGPGFDNTKAGVMVMLLFRLSCMAVGLVGGVLYGTGKMDFSGVGRESQGLTGIIRKGAARLMFVDMSYARVLVVDDIVTNLDVAKGILKPYGIKVDCANGGRQAIKMIRAGNPRYSAVFMDYMMPDIDGVETTRIIREEIGTDYARNIPIIALTSNASPENEKMFLHRGFQAFVAKPADMMKLDAVLQALVRNKNLEAKNSGTGKKAVGGKTEAVLPTAMAIRGVGMSQGVARFGGDESAFNKVLRSYAVNTPSLLQKLREYLTTDNFKNYEVVIHGIKGSSYGIFAQQVGMASETLEKAVKTRNFDIVRAEHARFEGMAQKLLDDIDGYLEHIDSAANAGKPVAPDPDASLLAELREACDALDMDRIDGAMAQLESFRYERGGELVAWLRNRVQSMKFEEIAAGEWLAGQR